MKRLLFIFAGAMIGLIVGLGISTPVNFWYTEHFVRSENDMNTHVGFLLLVVWPGFSLAGALLGNWFYHRDLTRRSRGTREQ
jgi:hypothetical protein